VRAVQSKDEVFNDPNTAVDEALTRQMGRGALGATIQVDGTVVTTHFKSKLINYARKRGLVGGSKFAPTMRASGCAMPAMRCFVAPGRP
jgi:hypothetical protein